MKKKFTKHIFLNHLMKRGGKNTSEKLFIKASKMLQKNVRSKKFEDIIKVSLINSSPHVFLKKLKRRKKTSIEVPFLLNNRIKISYGIKFILRECSLRRDSYSTSKKIFLEFLDSSNSKGSCAKVTNELYKKSFVNKKFSSYRWF